MKQGRKKLILMLVLFCGINYGVLLNIKRTKEKEQVKKEQEIILTENKEIEKVEVENLENELKVQVLHENNQIQEIVAIQPKVEVIEENSKEINTSEESVAMNDQNDLKEKLVENDDLKTEIVLTDDNIEEQLALEWEEQLEAELLNEVDLSEEIKLENLDYTIKKGDTIYDLSKEYKIKSDYIYANNIDVNLKVLSIGSKIKIPTENGIFYTVKKGDTLDGISQKFSVEVETLKVDNELEDVILIGSSIFIREPKMSLYYRSIEREDMLTGKDGFGNPLNTMKITSSFGTRVHPVLKKTITHSGIDLKAKTGTKVYSSQDGKVSFAGVMSGYGKIVIIKHSNGYETRYAHLSKINVKKGQSISRGVQLGLSGATGRVTGPHLHFEIRKKGEKLNPKNYLKI